MVTDSPLHDEEPRRDWVGDQWLRSHAGDTSSQLNLWVQRVRLEKRCQLMEAHKSRSKRHVQRTICNSNRLLSLSSVQHFPAAKSNS